MSTIDLLKLEIEREEALLAKETKQVEEMEKNAKRAEMERKRQAKNVSLLTFMTCAIKLFTISRNIPSCAASMNSPSNVRIEAQPRFLLRTTSMVSRLYTMYVGEMLINGDLTTDPFSRLNRIRNFGH